jgi:hypothetical protein
MNILHKLLAMLSLRDSVSVIPTRKMGSFICFCLISFVAAAQAQNFTYYVDSANGKDSNPGTEGSPWQSIAKVNSTILHPGQSVGFKSADTWRETLVVSQSGIAGDPIIFGAYGTGAQPIIDGSDILSSGWTLYSGNVWKHAFAPSNVNHPWVFFNGVAGGHNGGNPQSSISGITATNEWYWDGSSTLYVYSTSNPATAFTNPGVEATTRIGVRAPIQSYVTFQNLNVRKTSGNCFDMYQVNHGSVLNSTTSYCGERGIAFYNNADYAIVGSNRVSYSAESGISVDNSSYAQIYLNDTSHSGVLVDDSEGIGVWGDSGGNYIYFNYSHDNNDQTGPAGIRGIELDTITPPNVNYAHDNIATRNNASGIIVETSQNQMVWNNLSYNNAHGVGGNCCVSGIKDNDGAGNMFYNNTTAGNEFSELQVTNIGGVGPIVENNIFAATSTEQGAIVTNGSTGTAGTYDYNLLYGTTPLFSFGGTWFSATTFYPSTGKGEHDVYASPLFTSTPNSYLQSLGFGLSSGSPAIGKGIYISGVSTTNPPNLGAH